MFKRPKVMGILNVTPDSFSDGGRFDSLELAVKQALALIDQGADIIDIGGESTRPGAEDIDVDEEIRRTVPVIAAIREATKDFEIDPVISIDTRKSAVAEAAILNGADIWNDVTALTYDPASLEKASELACPVILMHIQGTPQTMQNSPIYDDAVSEIKDWLQARIDVCLAAGIEFENITIDPGIGFGKRQEDNLGILGKLDSFHALGCPILMGTSRKSFIGRIDGSTSDDRLGGSIASALWAASLGADILRVHDVSEMVQALNVWEAIANS